LCRSDPEKILEIYYFRVVASDEFEIEHQIPGSQTLAPRHSITRSSVRENTAAFLRKLIMLQECGNAVASQLFSHVFFCRDLFRLFLRIGTFQCGCTIRKIFLQTSNLATSPLLKNPKE
jgi:hypothetical protein